MIYKVEDGLRRAAEARAHKRVWGEAPSEAKGKTIGGRLEMQSHPPEVQRIVIFNYLFFHVWRAYYTIFCCSTI